MQVRNLDVPLWVIAKPYAVPPPHLPRNAGTHGWKPATITTVHPLWPDILRQRPFHDCGVTASCFPLHSDDYQISMGEGGTPLLRARNLGMMLGNPGIFIQG